MIIRSMTATFGGLENQTLTLKDGLNVFELPNEGGKSTWCAFLRAMLYGVETRKGRENSEKNRFTPWSGAKLSGSMEVRWQGKDITLRRFPKGSSPFGGFQAVYTGTEEPVPGLTADNVGQTLLGFGREVFERTCFIHQGGMAFGQSAELEQRLAALASSGEEDVSYSATEATLRSWRNALQSNRANGSIPQAKARQEACSAKLSRLTALENSLREADGQEEELLRREEMLQEQLNDLTRRQETAFQQEYAAAQDKLAQAAAEAPAKPSPPLSLLFVALFSLCAGVWMILQQMVTVGVDVLILGAILAAAAALSTYLDKKKYRALMSARQEKLATAQEELSTLAHRGTADTPAIAQTRAQLSAVAQSLAALRTRRAQADGELRAVGDPDTLREELDRLNAQLRAEEAQYAALTAAMDALAAANARLQQRFAPAVSALAGEILSKLTGGRYDSLTFTRSFEALAGNPTLEGKSALLLSKGTADQAYLALRLAICLLALPETDSAPLVLDDALVTFDDARLSLALQVLRDFSASRQVLVFTCQSRENAALAGNGLHGTTAV